MTGRSSLRWESITWPYVSVWPTMIGGPISADSSRVDQREPSMKRPCRNIPSSGYTVASAMSNMVEKCVSLVMLSSGFWVARAVTCLMAVRYAVGLKSPGIHTESGVIMVSLHSLMHLYRSRRSKFWDWSPFFEGQAYFSQVHFEKGFRPGNSLMEKATIMSSITSVMLSCPLRPLSRSPKVKRISSSSAFIRPHSCMATTT
mmetsp:Transcript_36918/g.82728  ORF Transcript_36918/g.82728 Transcript_36918/m.82728 type:complete len:202 (-) Transcript_36918:270-875(-)